MRRISLWIAIVCGCGPTTLPGGGGSGGGDGCSGSASRCTPDGRVQTCLPSGQYSPPTSCPLSQSCLGTSCIPTVCQPNQLFCRDATTAAQCNATGSDSTITEQCTGNTSCVNGRCLLRACAAAELLKSFDGCQFYAVDMNNYGADDLLENDIAVANSSRFTATVRVETKSGATWQTLCSATVPPAMTHAFTLRNPPS